MENKFNYSRPLTYFKYCMYMAKSNLNNEHIMVKSEIKTTSLIDQFKDERVVVLHNSTIILNL